MECKERISQESEKQPAMTLYVIQLETGPIKVGITTNLQQRMATYRTMNPYDFHIVHSVAGCLQDEQRLLRFLKAHIIQGEWVRNCSEARETIAVFFGVDNMDFSGITRKQLRPSSQRSNDYVYPAQRQLSDGTIKTYYYHPRSGTRLPDDPDSPEFKKALDEAKRMPAQKYSD